MRPNGQVERPRRSAGLATRAHNPFQRRRRPTTCASRPVPTLVRGRPHKPTVRARNLQRKPKLADATNPDRPAEAQPRQSAATSASLACWPHGPPARAQTEALTEGSWPSRAESGSLPTGGFLLRPLTVKLNGRAEAPDWRRGRTISSSARGAQPPAHHGPFQRWLEDAPTSLLCARGIFSANRSWLLQRCNEPRKPTAGIPP